MHGRGVTPINVLLCKLEDQYLSAIGASCKCHVVEDISKVADQRDLLPLTEELLQIPLNSACWILASLCGLSPSHAGELEESPV